MEAKDLLAQWVPIDYSLLSDIWRDRPYILGVRVTMGGVAYTGMRG